MKLAPPSELAELEREIALDSALVLLECNSLKNSDGWFELDGPVGNTHPHMCDEPEIRYLELRGLLERHPDNPDWVRIKEPPKEQP